MEDNNIRGELHKSFTDQFMYGESIMKTDANGTIRCIRFGSKEYEEIISQMDNTSKTEISIDNKELNPSKIYQNLKEYYD